MMNLKRIWAMIRARNREFFRDRAGLGWNFIFPFLLIGGFSIVFGGQNNPAYHVGVFPCAVGSGQESAPCIPDRIHSIQQIRYVEFHDFEIGLDKLKYHKIDLLLDTASTPYQYWISDTSSKGVTVEKLILATLVPDDHGLMNRQKMVASREIRYIDWLFPGILAMNLMFSALYGVGYVIVRYRKNGVLKRLNATPLTAFEYLSAQMISRMFLLMFTLVVLWTGCNVVFDFQVEGSYVDLFVIFFAGSLSMTSMGLIVASRGSSEEFANGMLNFLAWPMILLSEIWFSIDGAPQWVKAISNIFPLTHLLKGARSIINDGAGLVDVRFELTILLVMNLLFLLIGASLFSWNKKALL